MSINNSSVPEHSVAQVVFLNNKLNELDARKNTKLELVAETTREIKSLDTQIQAVNEELRRFKLYNTVFSQPDLWSHMTKFVAPENENFSRMLQVSKTWKDSCNQSYSTVADLQKVIDNLFMKSDWLTMNQLFGLSSKPAMRMKMLYETLKKRPAGDEDTARSNLKRFVERARGFELLAHTGNTFISNKRVVTYICKILMLFDDLPDEAYCGDSDPDESNGESESAVFIGKKSMLCVVRMLLDMFREHQNNEKSTIEIKKAMMNLMVYDQMNKSTFIQFALGGTEPGARFSFSPFTEYQLTQLKYFGTQFERFMRFEM